MMCVLTDWLVVNGFGFVVKGSVLNVDGSVSMLVDDSGVSIFGCGLATYDLAFADPLFFDRLLEYLNDWA